MKRVLICVIFGLMFFPMILGLDLEVEKKSSGEVLVLGTNQYATFDLEVTNNGPSEEIKFYNLVGFEMLPSEHILIKSGETKNIQLQIYPLGELNAQGGYILHYFVRGKDFSKLEFELPFIVTDLENAFEMGAGEINPESDSIEVYLHNKVNFNFDSIDIEFKSQFFDYSESFSLGPNEKKEFSIPLTKEDFKKLTAGFYTLQAEISTEDQSATLEAPVKFIENANLKTETESNGFFINQQIVRKINEGNTITKATIELKKNIISRLFTDFNTNPDAVERKGLKVTYIWNRDLKPDETLEISVVTNWVFPLLVIFLIVIITTLVKNYSRTNLIIKKKITFVKAKGGEFGLKISIFMHAQKYLENVNIIDRLPPLTKIHEKFGINYPSKIDEKNKKIEWTFQKLEEGETRVLSYYLYSKVGILGRFALPTATAIFERNGNIMETNSNRSFFVSEQKRDLFD